MFFHGYFTVNNLLSSIAYNSLHKIFILYSADEGFRSYWFHQVFNFKHFFIESFKICHGRFILYLGDSKEFSGIFFDRDAYNGTCHQFSVEIIKVDD